MFRTTIQNVGQKRTIRPLYAATQATPYAAYLDPNWNRATDIYPGMVMTRGTVAGDTVTLATTSGAKGFGLSALFIAPVLGIDEVKNSGSNNTAVWLGGPDSEFEILAPAFDPNADWSQPTDGTRKLLTHTVAAHAKGPGLVTVVGSTNAATGVIGEFLFATGTGKITIRLTQV